MAKNPRFDYRKTPKGWLVNIPGSVSDTGRFRRRYFETRDQAKAECQRLREIYQGGRAKASDITAALAEDATRAAELLAPFNVTLAQAAAFYASHHDTRSKAPTLSEAWRAAIENRPNHRERTIADLRAWRKALPAWFIALNVFDIEPAAIKRALDEVTKGRTRWKSGLRYISSVLGDCVKAGTIAENPVKRVHVERKPDYAADVSIYSPPELKRLMAACRDYDEGIDKRCASCTTAFAVMAFGGVRPEEVAKLRWDDVSLELHNIRIGPTIAKKARRRNVRINATLATWLEIVPMGDRQGRIVPTRWRFKAARVRKEAGIDGHEKQDALRHSFGTYMLAVENDLDALKSDMGHEHVRVFFEHYHKAVTKREAMPYWEVLPPGTMLPDDIN
ncbi:tyrosine-type recombinase/integrase [Luteolibacter soli]|uniref:Tyrosine-type recombinase/integrase n=1 Tax=Luteolibacter soli TaxID=3135280 RepID=A0ABU9B221_9BACT